MRLRFAFLLGLLPAVALAQQPPSETELLKYRAEAAEGYVKYYSSLLLRAAADQKATADWWAAYVTGLSTPHDVSQDKPERRTPYSEIPAK